VKSFFKLVAKILGLLLMALVLGVASNTVRTNRVPWRGAWSQYVEQRAWQAGLRLVGPATVRQAMETGDSKLLDARPAADFRAGHIPHAQSLPFEIAGEMLTTMQIDLDRDQAIITYCARFDCDEGLELAQFLRRAGYTHVALFAGGLSEWQAAGGRVEATP
jgi:rhodanese-related sulfurtransferase